MSLGSGQFSNQRGVLAHLTRGSGGLSGEIGDLRRDIMRELEANAAIAVEEFIDVAAADVDGIKTSFASAATVTTLSASDLNGAVGAGVMSPPRNLTITSSTHANIDAVAVEITGTDINGNEQTDTITLTDGGGATDVGTKAFATVTEVSIPAQGGASGSLQIGFGAVIGLGKPIKTRAGLTAPLREIAAGAAVTNGVFVAAVTSGPNGTYAPNTAPNGTNDYCLFYEYDAAQNE